MDRARGWIFGIIIVGILGYGVFAGLAMVEATLDNAVSPISNAQDSIATQVAEIANPTPTVIVDPVAIIHNVRALARLETVQYSIERVVTAESGQDAFGGIFSDKLLFVAHGTVIAGTDLAKLGSEDLWLVGDTLYVRLPDPEIFVATLDNEKSYVYDRETGIFTKGDVNLETAARVQAEAAIEESALEDGILDTAQKNAELFFTVLFGDLGYENIIFITE